VDLLFPVTKQNAKPVTNHWLTLLSLKNYVHKERFLFDPKLLDGFVYPVQFIVVFAKFDPKQVEEAVNLQPLCIT
jgi:hypothetical protein